MTLFSTGEIDRGGVDESESEVENLVIASSLLVALVIVTLSLKVRCCREPRLGGGEEWGDRVREARAGGEGTKDEE